MQDRGTWLAEHSRMAVVFVVLMGFVIHEIAVAFLCTLLKQTRFWGVPALFFGALSIVVFVMAEATPPPESGGPPTIDFGALPYYALSAAAFITACVAFAAGSTARAKYLEHKKAAPPELAVAIVHHR